MEPWFAALARPTAAVPPAAAHNNAWAWLTSGAGAVCERASRSSSARSPPVISKAPAAATIPPTLLTDHYLSDTPLGLRDLRLRPPAPFDGSTGSIVRNEPVVGVAS